MPAGEVEGEAALGRGQPAGGDGEVCFLDVAATDACRAGPRWCGDCPAQTFPGVQGAGDEKAAVAVRGSIHLGMLKLFARRTRMNERGLA